MTPAEIADHMARRKRLWEEKQKVVQVAPVSTGRGNKQFARETADTTGRDKSTMEDPKIREPEQDEPHARAGGRIKFEISNLKPT